MASDGQRVLFVHVQKTGGQSIEHVTEAERYVNPVGIDHETNLELAGVAGALHRLPVDEQRAHGSDGGDAVAEKDLLRFFEGLIELGGRGSRDRLVDKPE